MLSVVVILTLAAVCFSADPTQTCSDGKQTDYRGTKSTTVSGRTCQAWTSQSPHSHSRTPENYPSSGLEENYCRNPDNEAKAWCYTTDGGKRWEVCGIPTCEEEREGEVFEFGERKGVTVTLQGVDVQLATREDLGSFWCGSACEWVFTADSSPGTLWNIIPFKQGESQCYKIEKAGGYHAGETMRPGSKEWDEGEHAVQTDGEEGDSKCWEFVPVDGDNTFKIRKRFGEENGEFLRAPPVTFKDDDVPKFRRFVRVSNEDSFNVWQIQSV